MSGSLWPRPEEAAFFTRPSRRTATRAAYMVRDALQRAALLTMRPREFRACDAVGLACTEGLRTQRSRRRKQKALAKTDVVVQEVDHGDLGFDVIRNEVDAGSVE